MARKYRRHVRRYRKRNRRTDFPWSPRQKRVIRKIKRAWRFFF